MQAGQAAQIVAVKGDDVVDAHPGNQTGGAIGIVTKMGMDDRRAELPQSLPQPRQFSRPAAQARQPRAPQLAQEGSLGKGVQRRPRKPVEVLDSQAGDVLLKLAVAEADLVVNPILGLGKPGGAAMENAGCH